MNHSYEESGNIITEILSALENAECYEEVAIHAQRISTLMKIMFLGFSYIHNITP